MDTATAKRLIDLNSAFYQEHFDSFGSTRQTAWLGFGRCLEAAAMELGGLHDVSVLDLACGNLRFMRPLVERFAPRQVAYYAVDNCAGLVPDVAGVDFQNLDILDALLEGSPLAAVIAAPPADLTMALGFMHHVPTEALRACLMENLLALTKPGGVVIVSFWQFMRSAEMAAKAMGGLESALDELGLPQLEPGDYLLGWQGKAGAWRYCHSFSDDQIDRLVAGVSSRATVLDRFQADGKTGDLNCYLVLKAL